MHSRSPVEPFLTPLGWQEWVSLVACMCAVNARGALECARSSQQTPWQFSGHIEIVLQDGATYFEGACVFRGPAPDMSMINCFGR
jgi:hypothetical protein